MPREGMERIIESIERLKKTAVGRSVRARMREFRRKGRSGGDAIFSELCFCLLTANYTSEGGIRVQAGVGNGFMTLGREELAARLKSLGYRFPNARARYVVEARKHLPRLNAVLGMGDREAREWLAENVLGLGYKEASHFLRNIGRGGVAIIDFHIIDVLERGGLIEKPGSRSLGRKRYLEIERILARVAERAGMSQGELDLYLWYMETGKVLK
jgi:N-glycosylase/DNA lyase